MYLSQSFRSSTSAVENFQFFDWLSIRSRNRRFCSSFDTFRQRAVAGEVALECADILEPLLPDVLGDKPGRHFLFCQHLRMNPHDQDFFVIGPIEDSDAPALRKPARRPT